MKLSDIFNINLNTGGGNKLFAHIMNKYNIPKKEYKNIIKGLKQQSGSSSSGSSSKYITKYYSISNNIPTEFREICMFGSTIKTKYGNELFINPMLLVNDDTSTIIGFSFNPLYTEIYGVKTYVYSIEDLINITGLFEVLQYIQRITEEEYYTIN